MNVAIVDDMVSDREFLLENIEKYCNKYKVHLQVKSFENSYSFKNAFAKERFDFVFLDIYMNESNGIELAKYIQENDAGCQIVFTTSSQEHAIEAFQLHVLDYLLKPYTYERLEDCMKLYEKLSKKQARYIELKEGRYYTRILVSDIVYTDYHNHYIYVHTKNNIVRSYLPFPSFAPMLEDYPQFLCCYRNCLVNMDYVKYMDNGDFVLTTGERIPISRAKKQEIRQIYANYMFEYVAKGDG